MYTDILHAIAMTGGKKFINRTNRINAFSPPPPFSLPRLSSIHLCRHIPRYTKVRNFVYTYMYKNKKKNIIYSYYFIPARLGQLDGSRRAINALFYVLIFREILKKSRVRHLSSGSSVKKITLSCTTTGVFG